MIGGFGVQGGQPTNLMIALRDMNLIDLTLIGNVGDFYDHRLRMEKIR